MHLQLSRVACIQPAGFAALRLAPLDAALLLWLALEGPTPRNRLAQLLWPDSQAPAARNALRQRLFQLKRQLGAEPVVGQATLALAAGLHHDLEGASVLLADEPPAATGEYAAWLAAHRQRRRLQQQAVLALQADAAEALSDWPAALAAVQAWLALAPLAEDAHRRLMRLHYLAGDRAAALLAFDRCEQLLKNEVGARPAPETLALLATVEQSGPGLALSAVHEVPGAIRRPPRTVGRAAEWALLQSSIAAGDVLALIADAGVGKSRLLQDLAAQAGRPVLHVAARPGDAAVPLSTLARLLRALLGPARATPAGGPFAAWSRRATDTPPAVSAALALLLPELDPAAGPGGPPARAPAGALQPLALQQGLLRCLQSCPGGAVLLLDDLHHADAASLDLLQGALADIHGKADLPLRWVLAYRPPEPGSPLAALHATLADSARLQAVPLHALDLPAVVELVDSLGLPGVHGHALAPGLLRRTGGNPLFLLETLKQAWVEGLLRPGADGQHLPRPVSVGRLIEQRLSRLPAPALALARVAAIAGVDFGIELAAAVLQVAAMQLADDVNALEAAHVLRGLEFAHDLVLDAVRNSVPASVAAHTHARVAQWLVQQGGEPARIALHWTAAGQPARALPALRAAAEAARLALRGREQLAFLLEAAGIEEALGDHDAAFETLHTLLAARIHVDRQVLGWQLCDRLDALARSAAQQGRAHQRRAWFAFNRGELEAALAAAGQQQTLALTLGDEDLAADACHVQALALSMQGQDGAALAAMRQAEPLLTRQAASRDLAEFMGSYGMLLDHSGQHEAAQAQHRLAIALATDIGHHAHAVVVRSNLALSLRRSGLLHQALEQLQQAERLRGLHDQMDGPAVNTLPALTLVLAELGHDEQALACCDRAEAHLAQHSPAWLGVVHNHRALIWVQLGQWARATQALQAAALASTKAPAWLAALRMLQVARLARFSRLPAEGVPLALAALAQASACVSTRGRSAAIAQALTLERCALLPPEEASPLAQDVLAQALAMGHYGVAAAAAARAAASAAALLPAGPVAPQAAAAPLRLAERALGLLGAYQVNDAHAPETVLNLVLALQRVADSPEASRNLVREAARGLTQRAAQHVPEACREAFLVRHPVHRELLALASRL